MSKKSRPWTRQQRKAIRKRTERLPALDFKRATTASWCIPVVGLPEGFVDALLDLGKHDGTFVAGAPSNTDVGDLFRLRSRELPPDGCIVLDPPTTHPPSYLNGKVEHGPNWSRETTEYTFPLGPADDTEPSATMADLQKHLTPAPPMDDLMFARLKRGAVSAEDYAAMIRGEKPWPPGWVME